MNLSPDDARAELTKAVPELLAANKCPDFIADKGPLLRHGSSGFR